MQQYTATIAPLEQSMKMLCNHIQRAQLIRAYGHVMEIKPPVVKAAMPGIRIGEICSIHTLSRDVVQSEVIAVNQDAAILSPIGSTEGMAVGDRVERNAKGISFGFSQGLCGLVLDGLGQVFSGQEALEDVAFRQAKQSAPPALDRPLISKPFVTGVPAIDGLITLGHGQRIAILGAPGTGKSSLLANIATFCDADVVVIGLVGERGREVQEFLSRHLPEHKRDRVVIVAATSERPPMERIYAAHVATSVAEGFRDAGKSVLLMVDSITRFARACREVGLAAGEAPTRRGYPASVYAALPQLIERAGPSGKGDITAIYSVLSEGDGVNDPIAEELRSLTDGHIELSMELAASGHFPAVDVAHSVSRVMPHLITNDHAAAAQKTRNLMAKYEEIRLLIQIGEYKAGQDKLADHAIRAMPAIRQLLQEGASNSSSLNQISERLERCVA